MIRTDLAIEAREVYGQDEDGIESRTETKCGLEINTIVIKSEAAAKKLDKSVGTYITVEIPSLTSSYRQADDKIEQLGDIINGLLPKDGLVLVAGIGNIDITPDALGPKAMPNVLATRHITGELAKQTGLDNLRPTAVLSPGVLGQTGIETNELIFSVTEKIKPCAVIAVDALASRRLERLGCTIQICDTGISPGAGVGNNRLMIDKDSLGVPVIGIGVPTVVDAVTLATDLLGYSVIPNVKKNMPPQFKGMVVTPREVDMLTDRAAKLIGMAINCALQQSYSVTDLMTLVG